MSEKPYPYHEDPGSCAICDTYREQVSKSEPKPVVPLPKDFQIDDDRNALDGIADMFRYMAGRTRAVETVYIIGSLRNPRVPHLGVKLREAGYDVFDDWFGGGPEADDYWQKYEKLRGRTFKEALKGDAAQTMFHLDRTNMDRCDVIVLVLPAGKSAHLELGIELGKGKPGFILMDGEPERFDLMYNFATDIYMSEEELLDRLSKTSVTRPPMVGQHRFKVPEGETVN